MNILYNLCFYIAALLVSCIVVHNIVIRIEQRIGLGDNFLLLVLRSLHGILIKLPYILLMFFAAHIVVSYSGRNNAFVLLSLFIMISTITPFRARRYGFIVINTSSLLSLIVVSFTAINTLSTGATIIAVHNPFTVFSFFLGILLVVIICYDETESVPLNLSRNLSLNIFLASLYVVDNNFMHASVIAFACVIIQYIIRMIMPRLNVHKNMEYSLSIVLTASLLCFVGNIIWLMMLEGKSVSLLFRI
ncbi:MAG: hypothetical protein JXA66_03320 [Oligoflexia bacterium]|nr:hypothetical protein [Oligoflexia bacterium]